MCSGRTYLGSKQQQNKYNQLPMQENIYQTKSNENAKVFTL